MRNKARCNYLKKIFACCALALLFFSIAVPCFASDVYTGSTPSPLTLDPQLQISGGWTVDNCEAMAQIVEKAYSMNYFSGGIPVAIVRSFTGAIFVYVATPVSYLDSVDISGNSYSGVNFIPPGVYRNTIYGSFDNDIIRCYSSDTNEQYCMIAYLFATDYNFIFQTADITTISWREDAPTLSAMGPCVFGVKEVPLTGVNRIIGLRLGEDFWECDGESDIWCGYYNGYGNAVSPFLTDILRRYENRITIVNEVTEEIIYNYELDVPSIITAIPEGARQLINNAFGFEIFGINVAGLLSVLSIVAIIAFAVKWLMSR